MFLLKSSGMFMLPFMVIMFEYIKNLFLYNIKKIKNNKPAPPGTYTWLVKYTDPDNVQHEVAGSVTIVK